MTPSWEGEPESQRYRNSMFFSTSSNFLTLTMSHEKKSSDTFHESYCLFNDGILFFHALWNNPQTRQFISSPTYTQQQNRAPFFPGRSHSLVTPQIKQNNRPEPSHAPPLNLLYTAVLLPEAFSKTTRSWVFKKTQNGVWDVFPWI